MTGNSTPFHQAFKWLGVLTAVMTFAACGGGPGTGTDGTTSSPQGSLTLVAHAMASGDAPRVCSLLYGEAQLKLQDLTGSSNCVDAVTKANQELSSDVRDGLSEVTSFSVSTDEGTATASGKASEDLALVLGLSSPLTLSNFEDDWMIQSSSETPHDKATSTQ